MITAVEKYSTITVFFLYPLLLLLVIASPLSIANADVPQRKINVLMVNPSIKDDPFWHKTQRLTQEAAKAMNMNLTVIHGDGTRFFQLEAIKGHFNKPAHNTDYIILINYPGNAEVTMRYLEKQNVKVITLEQTLSDEELFLIGKPGVKYKNWLGEIYFDNQQASFLLAESLFKQVAQVNLQPIVAGISGHFGSESTLRNNGLLDAANQYNAKVTQIVHAGWSAEDAYDKTYKLLQRYPSINTLWCASDHMALGALKAVEELGLTPGKDIFIGGFDWTSPALKSIYNNKLSASVGGHFMMGAIAIIAIYDIVNDIPHQPFVDSTHNSFALALITKDNIKTYYDLLTLDNLDRIDFKVLAKLYSREEEVSTFNLLKMLDTSIKTHDVKPADK